MASTYTNSGFELIGDDEQFEQWGFTENTNKELVDEAINGVVSLALTETAHTLTTSDGETGDTLALAGRHKVLRFTGSPGGTCTVTIDPNGLQKLYVVDNQTDQSVIMYQGSGATVTILSTKIAMVYCDGAGAGAAVKLVTTAVGASTGDGNYETTSALHTYGAGAANELVETFGLTTVGDGGGGKWYYSTSADRSDANLGTILDTTVAFTVAAQGTGTGTGCWVREHDGTLNAAWWGVGTAISTDNSLALQGALDLWISVDGAHLVIPPGDFNCSTALECDFTALHFMGNTISGYGASLKDLTTGTTDFWSFLINDGILNRNLKLNGITIEGSNTSSNSLIYVKGEDGAYSGEYFYRITFNDINLETVKGHGMLLDGIFESTFNTCNVQHSFSSTHHCIYFTNNYTSSIFLTNCTCYGGKNGIRTDGNISDIHIVGGTILAQEEYGLYIANAYNRSIRGIHFENCWKSAADLASGNAGAYIVGRGTIIDCTGTTNQQMKYVVRIWMLDNSESTIIGGAATGDVVSFAVVSGAATSGQVSVIGGASVTVTSGNATVVRL